MIEFFKSYFQPPIEKYFYINAIPEYQFSGLPDHFYFYLILSLIVVLLLILSTIFLWRRWTKINFNKILLYFLLIFWLITSVRWLVIQSSWIKDDIVDFKAESIIQHRTQAMVRFMQSIYLPESWYDFYHFLEFARAEIPFGATIYLLPADYTFWNWSKYWLYPDLELVTSMPADYIASFNIDLGGIPEGYEYFKEFGPNKFILKIKQ